MLLYISIAIWPLIIQYMYKHRPLYFGEKQVEKNKYIILALIPFFLVLAFRGERMGADAGTYVRHFMRMTYTPLKVEMATSRMEIGYLIFVKLLTYITQNGLIYQIMCVTCMFFGMYTFLKELEIEDALLYIYFYCTLGLFFFMFTGTRQCLAMGICLFSYKLLTKKQYLKFILCMLLAFCFHKSAVLFIMVLFMYNKKINIFNTIIYCSVVVIAGRNINSIQEWFNDTLEYNYEIEYTGSGMIFLIVLLLLSVFSMIMIYNRDGGFNRNVNTRVLININFITLVLWVLRLQTRVAERPSYYFMFFSCALYAHALNTIKDSKERNLFKMIICGFTMLLFIYRLKTNFAVLIPYEFYQ